MPNLDNIFNKFFPQSQTGAKGIFLLRMAWTVEIIVAIIGLLIGILVIKGAQTMIDPVTGVEKSVETLTDVFAKGIYLNDVTIGLIFIIVAIVELAKIPLATAVYYSVRLSWKVVFLIGLLLINVSTFETIVTGFERINRERTKVVEKLIVEYKGIKTQLENLSTDKLATNIQESIDHKIEERKERQKTKSKIISDASIQKNEIKGSSSNEGVITTLVEEIKNINSDISALNTENQNLQKSLGEQKGLFTSKGDLRKQIAANKEKIIQLENKRDQKSDQLTTERQTASADTSGEISIIDESKDAQIKLIDEEIEKINADIEKERERQREHVVANKDEKIRELKDRKLELIEEIDDQAPDNQVFRVARWFRNWFEVDYTKEITDLEQRILKLEKSKLSDTYFSNWLLKKIFFFIKKENTPQDYKIIDKQILRLENQITDYERKMNRVDVSSTEQSVYADIPEAARIAAFWLWFGVLSFIISVTGTMLAFASLVLLDPRLHIIRNKPGANWRGVARRISGFFVLINKYIWGRVKRLKDPKIVEKEVVVEKVVEKIVEKNIGEKIRLEKIEVPAGEVVRKEIVYVPLPTDDTDILKKGPFSVPEDEKDKTKK